MRAVCLLLVTALAASSGCRSGLPEGEAVAALSSYFEAVRAGGSAPIASLLEDCRAEALVERGAGGPPSCELRIAELQASVAAQRELDAYRFDDPWGFGLVRALVLGGGGFWTLDGLRLLEDSGDRQRWEASLTARTQYRADETAGLPRGAVVEYLVAPLGAVRRLPVGGEAPGAVREELVELPLRAELVRRREGWRVVSLLALRDRARFRTVTWRPR